MHMPVLTMIPDRPVMFTALFKLRKKPSESLHPVLFDPEGQGIGEKSLKKLRCLLRWIAEIHFVALGDFEKPAEALQLIEQQPAGPGRCLQQVMEENVDANGAKQNSWNSR